MIIEQVFGNIAHESVEGLNIDYVMLDWFELDKTLLRKKTQAGEEIGIRIKGHIHEGDILYKDDNKAIVVDLLPCELTEVCVETKKEMGRLGFELGNRHLSLAIEEDKISIPYDEPTFLYLVKKGFHPKKVMGKFSHFTVCHAHEHQHQHESEEA